MKIVSQSEVERRIKEKYPNEPFEIIKYTRMTKEFIIKCNLCGEVRRYGTTNNFFNGLHICQCLGRGKNFEISKKHEKEILELISKDENKEFVSFGKEKTQKN